MARIAAVANLKGGVGKTTTTYALGDALARRGYRVLMIDLDPQASLTLTAGVDPVAAERERRTIGAALDEYLRYRDVLDVQAVCYRVVEGLDLLPTTMALVPTEKRLRNETLHELVLRKMLEPAHADYDAIIIDCAPSPSALMMNALGAAHGVVIPVVPEFLAVQGLTYLFDTVHDVQISGLNPALGVDGLILTMIESRTIHSREMQQDIAAYLAAQPESPPILGEIKRSIKVAEAASHRQAITRFAPASDQALAYEQIAHELLTHWGQSPVTSGQWSVVSGQFPARSDAG